MFMFHNYSSIVVGKGGEMYDNILHERKWSDRIMRKVYDGFLTEEEIKAILNNKDIWMDGEEVLKRLKAKQLKKMEKPAAKKPAAKKASKDNGTKSKK